MNLSPLVHQTADWQTDKQSFWCRWRKNFYYPVLCKITF